MTVWRHGTFRQLAERDTGVRCVGNGGNAVGGERILSAVRLVPGSRARPSGGPVLGPSRVDPGDAGRCASSHYTSGPPSLSAGARSTHTGGEVEIVDAHGPYLESDEGGQGVIHASLPVGSELFSIITSAQSASASWSNETPISPFGSIALTSEWLRSRPPFWPTRRLSQ